MSDTLCWAPWSNLTITNDGNIRPCCMMITESEDKFISENGSSYNINVIGDFESYTKSKTILSIKQSMIKGEWHPLCRRCEAREKAGVTSVRNEYNNTLNRGQKELPSRFRLKQLDLSFNNKCNLRCRMCSPMLSNLLAKEWPTLNIEENRSYHKRYETPDHINLDSIKELIEMYHSDLTKIRFAGGEPLIHQEHDDLLSWMIDSGFNSNIELMYSTNGTILTEANLRNWPHFKKVNITVSIDAFGELNRYIRYPANWTIIHNNMNKLNNFARDHNNIQIAISTAVQALNVTRLHELLPWIRQFEFINQLPHMKIVTDPKSSDPRIIPRKLRQDCMKIFLDELNRINCSTHIFYNRILQLIKMLETSDDMFDRFNNFVDINIKFDKARKTNLFEILPELIPYVNSTS